MDSAPVHISEEIKNLYLSNNKRLLFIPSGLTSVLQPLDVSINKLFKEEVRNKYAEYLIKNKDMSNKVNREDIIKWIADVWYSDKIISKLSIINTFKGCGISNNINKKDDNIGYNLSTHGDIEKISFIPNEREVLFFPFSSFEIKDIKKQK